VRNLLERLRSLFEERPVRERWLLVLALGVVMLVLVHALVIAPLQTRLRLSRAENERLETALLRGTRMAADVRRLQTSLSRVEARIAPTPKANLFTLLESLATQAEVKDRLESIKPKQPSGSESYPETRVEVSLKGATLAQTIQFLYRIETAPVHLIVRSLRIRSRRDAAGLLDATFSVSSFERAEAESTETGRPGPSSAPPQRG
jgi:Tfp pilus assembly protein PilO